ncbi:MAG: hypothetical protein QF903_05625 [Planctomycetota bacterium]|nr:hypothetical protein [Planctomycetota bacterium]MDP6762687.1 hypothetical protein [Planctomycetota bacterium]MDP6988939.1 hypothetical protein [Planctomycetota bacterium]
MLVLSVILFFCSPPAPQAEPVAPPPRAVLDQDPDRRAEYDRRREAAGKDVEALWELHVWCSSFGMSKESRSCLRAILKLDRDHKGAREASGHLFYDGRWFTTQKKLDKYKKEEEERIAKEKGLVRFEGGWVPAEDLPFLRQGLVRDDLGDWVSKEDLERQEAGWIRQDLVWIKPEEADNVDKGLWKCGERWLDQKEADAYHAELDTWWVIPSEHFLLHTTCDREVAEKGLDAMERAWRDLRRVFGALPEGRVPVALLRDAAQYGVFAAGDQVSGRPGVEFAALSSIHYAFFADAWFDRLTGAYMGGGAAYWDASAPNGNSFGPHAARHAAAHSVIEALDPSPTALAKATPASNPETLRRAFYKEKKLPEWFRYGAAAYAERYFIDSLVAAGGKPHWAREWSIENIVSKGGLRPVRQILSTELSISDPNGSAKLINERGLVMAFILDGACEPVLERHKAIRDALAAGEKNLDKLFDALATELHKQTSELRKFADL